MSASENSPDCDIRISAETKPFPIQPARIRALIRNVLSQFEAAACVDVAVVDDAAISQMHGQYLVRPKTTDVISFDLSDDRSGRRCFQIIVNAQQAARQAVLRGHAPQEELALYIVHGLLHHLGYDDADARQARRMHRMEDRILRRNGCGAVYYHEESQTIERKRARE